MPADQLPPHAVLSALKRRGVDVDIDLCSGCSLHLGGTDRLPHVLADAHADTDAAKVDHRALGPALEIAFLVKDTVVGEVDLPVDGGYAASVQESRCVIDRGVVLCGTIHKSDDGADANGPCGDLIKRGPVVPDKPSVQHEIFWRVSGDRQFRERHQLCAGLARRYHGVDYQLDVAVDISDGGVHLRQRYTENPHVSELLTQPSEINSGANRTQDIPSK